MFRSLGVALGALVLWGLAGGAEGRAQDSAMSELYGRGVHAYFDNDYREADALLSEAIQIGTADPRAYYFRGLIYAQTDRRDEARADFETGARLEVAGQDRVYDVGRSLQRVQGSLRLELEQHRREARLAASIRRQREERARYDRIEQAEPDVVRGAGSSPPELPAFPSDVQDPTNPFADDVAPPAEVEAPQPPQPGTQPAGEQPAPAAEDAPMPAQPAGDDPFGEQPADADPFGTQPAAPAEDPFGTQPAAPAEDPFGTQPAAPAEDPFGTQPAAPAEDTGAAPTEGNPFGEAELNPAEVFGDAASSADDMTRSAPPGDGPLGAIFRALTSALPDEAPIDMLPEMGPDLLAPGAPAGDPAELAPAQDPFGITAGEIPAEQQPGATTQDDPFGAPQPAPADDPFGAPQSAPAEDDPFGASTTEDPFGAPGPAPSVPPPADDDPFGSP